MHDTEQTAVNVHLCTSRNESAVSYQASQLARRLYPRFDIDCAQAIVAWSVHAEAAAVRR